jgi:hypothetical protein
MILLRGSNMDIHLIHIFHNFIHLGIQDLSLWVIVNYGDPFYVIASMYCHNDTWCVFEFKHGKIKEFHIFLHLTIKNNLENKIHSYVLL